MLKWANYLCKKTQDTMQDTVSFVFDQAIAYALTRLERDLPVSLVYHSLAHTHDEVVPIAAHLARMEGINDRETLLLLRTAAYYHDIGFVEQSYEHEAAGVQIARAVLPQFGYNAAQIELIEGLIMATRLPPSPRTLLEQILTDADLDSLGRFDFFSRSLDLRVELAASGIGIPLSDWYRQQLEFLSTHRYFTSSAHALRNVGKQHNIALLQSLITQQATSYQ
jgi:uncharacterized protein